MVALNDMFLFDLNTISLVKKKIVFMKMTSPKKKKPDLHGVPHGSVLVPAFLTCTCYH